MRSTQAFAIARDFTAVGRHPTRHPDMYTVPQLVEAGVPCPRGSVSQLTSISYEMSLSDIAPFTPSGVVKASRRIRSPKRCDATA
jgi:hypothetical protein